MLITAPLTAADTPIGFPPTAAIAVLSDDAAALRALRETTRGAAFCTADAADFLRYAQTHECRAIVLDLDAPGTDALALCRLLRAGGMGGDAPLLALARDLTSTAKLAALEAGFDDYLTKDAGCAELRARVADAQNSVHYPARQRELDFLADLGRTLLRARAPREVIERAAAAAYEGVGATVCAVWLENAGDAQAAPLVRGFDREGMARDAALLDPARLRAWLIAICTPQGTLRCDAADFLLTDETHRVEYSVPLLLAGVATGALVVGFDRAADCGLAERRLLEVAAQQIALAAQSAQLYAAAEAFSAKLAEQVRERTAEVEAGRLFTESIIDSLPVSLYAIDRKHRIVAWNRNRELGGQGIPRGRAIGRSIFDVLTRQKRKVLEAEFARAFATGEIGKIETQTLEPDGRRRYWQISKIPMRLGDSSEVTHIITVGEDITTRVSAGQAVARAEKLAAVGRLAAGVVHEINNPLATISACAEALQARLADNVFADAAAAEDFRDYLTLIHDEAFRCKGITNGLLDFSRARVATEYAPVQTAEVVRAAARLIAHQKRNPTAVIIVDVPETLPCINGDAGQLQQAVIALATNALDAMPEGGTLTLRARLAPRKPDAPDVAAALGAAFDARRNLVQRELHIEVSDTGVGIAPEHLSQIFDPFFTTKEIGQGTGLGLAVCYGIVTEHGGRLDVQSAPAVGTTFTISLPVIEQLS